MPCNKPEGGIGFYPSSGKESPFLGEIAGLVDREEYRGQKN